MVAQPINTLDYRYRTPMAATSKRAGLRFVAATPADGEAVLELFGALHRYNAGLDGHFALAAGWESILRAEFEATVAAPDRLWVLVKDGDQAVGLLMAGVHEDSPLFAHRRWVEVQGLYVAGSHRRRGIAQRLLARAYAWAESLGLARVQLYVTASNVRAIDVYANEGFVTAQAIMRKAL